MISKLAKCPFYSEEDKRSITCEGIVSKKSVQLFKAQQEKESQKDHFCNANYQNCTYFQAVEKKY